MKSIKIIYIFLLVLLCQQAIATNHFTLAKMKEQGQLYRLAIDTTFTKSATICPFKNKYPISGLCISGAITKHNDAYLVRVILKDKEGHEHCVLESYDMINNALSFSFTNYCEETALLDNIEPDSLIIVTHFATLRLDSISALYNKYSSKKQESAYFTTKANIKRAQVDSIINRINSYNMTHRKLWGAGATPLALKRYEQKINPHCSCIKIQS